MGLEVETERLETKCKPLQNSITDRKGGCDGLWRKKRKDVDVGSMLGKISGVLTSREIHRKKFNMKMKIMCCALKVCCG